MLARRPIASARRKLLAEELGGTGGVKSIPGQCDELLRAVDGNPFVPLTTRAALLEGLQALDRSLS